MTRQDTAACQDTAARKILKGLFPDGRQDGAVRSLDFDLQGLTDLLHVGHEVFPRGTGDDDREAGGLVGRSLVIFDAGMKHSCPFS